MGKWFNPKLVGHLMEGLRKAGLDILGRSEQEYQQILLFAGMAGFDPLRGDTPVRGDVEQAGAPSHLRGHPPDSGIDLMT